MRTQVYYLGRECELIHEIDGNESLIEIVEFLKENDER